jgi:aspartate/tyrosine/aromatic aminotransferase
LTSLCWQAEQAMLEEKLDKEYAPISGKADFCLESAKLAFGADSVVIKEGRVRI